MNDTPTPETDAETTYLFHNRDGKTMRLSGSLTMEEMIRDGWADFKLVKPGTPLGENVWRCDFCHELPLTDSEREYMDNHGDESPTVNTRTSEMTDNTLKTMQTNTQSTEGKAPQQTKGESSTDGATCSAFQFWWQDMDNGCPQLVLDNDEEFAVAVWNAAIKSAMLALPGGNLCDPQEVADTIRELIEPNAG